jgi:hypothetical protein
MGLSTDWREFLELPTPAALIMYVGTHSLALHGRPRYAGDLDILVRSTPENARILVDLLNQFGFGLSGFEEFDFFKTRTANPARTCSNPNWSAHQY